MVLRSLGFVLASVLLYSSIQHLKNPYHFLGTVYSYELLSPQMGLWVASLLPLAQLVFAAMIFARFWESAVAIFVSVMFATFLVAQLTAWLRGLAIPCGCFGLDSDTAIGWQTITLVLALLAIALTYLYCCISLQKAAASSATVCTAGRESAK